MSGRGSSTSADLGGGNDVTTTMGESRVSDGSDAVACAQCGTTAEELPLTWVSSVERGRTLYYCDACARTNLRSIEARLDSAWW